MNNQVKLNWNENTVQAMLEHNQSFVHNILTLIYHNKVEKAKVQFLEKDKEVLIDIARKYYFNKSLSAGQYDLIRFRLKKYVPQFVSLFNKLQGS